MLIALIIRAIALLTEFNFYSFFSFIRPISLSLFFDLFFGQQSFMHVVMQSFSQCLLMFIINVQTSHIWIDG